MLALSDRIHLNGLTWAGYMTEGASLFHPTVCKCYVLVFKNALIVVGFVGWMSASVIRQNTPERFNMGWVHDGRRFVFSILRFYDKYIDLETIRRKNNE